MEGNAIFTTITKALNDAGTTLVSAYDAGVKSFNSSATVTAYLEKVQQKRKIKESKKRVKHLYNEMSRESIKYQDPVEALESEPVQKIIARIRELQTEIDLIKEQLHAAIADKKIQKLLKKSKIKQSAKQALETVECKCQEQPQTLQSTDVDPQVLENVSDNSEHNEVEAVSEVIESHEAGEITVANEGEPTSAPDISCNDEEAVVTTEVTDESGVRKRSRTAKSAE